MRGFDWDCPKLLLLHPQRTLQPMLQEGLKPLGVTVQEVWAPAWNSEHVEEHRNSFGHVVLLPPSFLSLKHQEPLLISIQVNLASVTHRNWIFVFSLFKCFWKKDVLSDCFIYLLCYFLLFTVEETEYQSFACVYTAVLANWNLSYWNSHTNSVFFSISSVHTDAKHRRLP